ncbi:ABC transporter permease [Georgenia sp. Z1344]|uniref:ABC transporter permease n=1 Tax=Georgenia sp. Z1344 TaxID=3416706 RepID=UPI003CFACF74
MSVAPARVRSRLRVRRAGDVLLPLGVVVLLLALLQVLAVTGAIPSDYLPPPTEIGGELVTLLGGATLWGHIGSTVTGWAMSLGIAAVLGTLVGILLGSVESLRALTTPLVEFLRPLPSIALIPLVILLIGGGRTGEVFLASFAAFWQMLVAAIDSARSVDPVARETAAAFGLNGRQRIAWVYLPSMLPQLITGVRIASAMALVIVVTTEILIGVPGLGQGLNLARSGGELARMYAYIVVIGIVGLVLNAAIRWVGDRAISWHPSVRKGTR